MVAAASKVEAGGRFRAGRVGGYGPELEAGVGIGRLSACGYIGGELACEVGIHHSLGVENQLAKRLDRRQRAVGNEAVRDSSANGVPGGLAGFKRKPLQRFEAGFADAANGRVDHSLQCHRVVRIADEAKIAEQVFDFGALVKAEPADHRVRDVVAAQCFLNQAGLRVGSIKHGTMRRSGVFSVRRACLVQKGLDAVGDEQSFVFAIRRLVITNQRTTLAVGPQLLALAAYVVCDNGAGSFQNDLRRTVVLFQPDDAGVGEVFFKLQNIANVCAAPRIDTLILIADRADVLGFAGEQLHQLVLRAVGVLVFVDQEITVAALIALPGLARYLEQANGLKQQVVEVESIVLAQFGLVSLVDMGYALAVWIFGGEVVLLRIDHVVLGP